MKVKVLKKMLAMAIVMTTVMTTPGLASVVSAKGKNNGNFLGKKVKRNDDVDDDDDGPNNNQNNNGNNDSFSSDEEDDLLIFGLDSDDENANQNNNNNNSNNNNNRNSNNSANPVKGASKEENAKQFCNLLKDLKIITKDRYDALTKEDAKEQMVNFADRFCDQEATALNIHDMLLKFIRCNIPHEPDAEDIKEMAWALENNQPRSNVRYEIGEEYLEKIVSALLNRDLNAKLSSDEIYNYCLKLGQKYKSILELKDGAGIFSQYMDQMIGILSERGFFKDCGWEKWCNIFNILSNCDLKNFKSDILKIFKSAHDSGSLYESIWKESGYVECLKGVKGDKETSKMFEPVIKVLNSLDFFQKQENEPEAYTLINAVIGAFGDCVEPYFANLIFDIVKHFDKDLINKFFMNSFLENGSDSIGRFYRFFKKLFDVYLVKNPDERKKFEQIISHLSDCYVGKDKLPPSEKLWKLIEILYDICTHKGSCQEIYKSLLKVIEVWLKKTNILNRREEMDVMNKMLSHSYMEDDYDEDEKKVKDRIERTIRKRPRFENESGTTLELYEEEMTTSGLDVFSDKISREKLLDALLNCYMFLEDGYIDLDGEKKSREQVRDKIKSFFVGLAENGLDSWTYGLLYSLEDKMNFYMRHNKVDMEKFQIDFVKGLSSSKHFMQSGTAVHFSKMLDILNSSSDSQKGFFLEMMGNLLNNGFFKSWPGRARKDADNVKNIEKLEKEYWEKKYPLAKTEHDKERIRGYNLDFKVQYGILSRVLSRFNQADYKSDESAFDKFLELIDQGFFQNHLPAYKVSDYEDWYAKGLVFHSQDLDTMIKILNERLENSSNPPEDAEKILCAFSNVLTEDGVSQGCLDENVKNHGFIKGDLIFSTLMKMWEKCPGSSEAAECMNEVMSRIDIKTMHKIDVEDKKYVSYIKDILIKLLDLETFKHENLSDQDIKFFDSILSNFRRVLFNDEKGCWSSRDKQDLAVRFLEVVINRDRPLKCTEKLAETILKIYENGYFGNSDKYDMYDFVNVLYKFFENNNIISYAFYDDCGISSCTNKDKYESVMRKSKQDANLNATLYNQNMVDDDWTEENIKQRGYDYWAEFASKFVNAFNKIKVDFSGCNSLATLDSVAYVRLFKMFNASMRLFLEGVPAKERFRFLQNYESLCKHMSRIFKGGIVDNEKRGSLFFCIFGISPTTAAIEMLSDEMSDLAARISWPKDLSWINSISKLMESIKANKRFGDYLDEKTIKKIDEFIENARTQV